jgi:hypothetical protein
MSLPQGAVAHLPPVAPNGTTIPALVDRAYYQVRQCALVRESTSPLQGAPALEISENRRYPLPVLASFVSNLEKISTPSYKDGNGERLWVA